MFFSDALPTWLSWILVIVEAIITIALLINYKKARDSKGVWGQIGSILGIIITIISMYGTLPVTKYIFSFAPVEYHNSGGYTEGVYYGWWKDGMPEGYGHLTFNNFSDDKTYSLNIGDYHYRGLYYEGEFKLGRRYGQGTMYYEGGYRDEGMYYGAWSEGTKVFEGKRWLTNDTYNCYCEIEVWATGPITARDVVKSDWIEQ